MQRHVWRLVAPEASIVRYCQGCGGKADFRRSGKVRRNANGSRIFQYDIYKCRKDHTWNRVVPATEPDAGGAPRCEGSRLDEIPFTEDVLHTGLEIHLEYVQGRWRLDKTLARQLTGTTRSAVAALIACGAIRVNGVRCEGRHLLKTDDRITFRRPESGPDKPGPGG